MNEGQTESIVNTYLQLTPEQQALVRAEIDRLAVKHLDQDSK